MNPQIFNTHPGHDMPLKLAMETLARHGAKGTIAKLERGPPPQRADAALELEVNGTKYQYAIATKTTLDRLTALGQIRARLAETGERGMLLAPYVTNTMAQQCKAMGLEFIDLAGNAYIDLPGFYLYITGEKPPAWHVELTPQRGVATAAALRMIFALLCRPDLLNAPYREIVETTGIALGAVGWVFFDLERRGLIAGKQRKRNRRLLEPARLFDEWVTNYPLKLRPKLRPKRFRAENPEWWKIANITNFHAYWGGELAAVRLTNYLKPTRCTIYMNPNFDLTTGNQAQTLTDLVTAHRLRADPQGDIELLDTFWKFPADPMHTDIVPPILAYADLVATLDPRNIEVANIIRKQHIDALLRQA